MRVCGREREGVESPREASNGAVRMSQHTEDEQSIAEPLLLATLR